MSTCLVARLPSRKRPFASSEAYAKAERVDSAVASAGGRNNGYDERLRIAQRLLPRKTAESYGGRNQRNHPASGLAMFVQLLPNARTENRGNEIAPRVPGDPSILALLLPLTGRQNLSANR